MRMETESYRRGMRNLRSLRHMLFKTEVFLGLCNNVFEREREKLRLL